MAGNITALINGYNNPGDYLYELCLLSNHWMAYAILLVVGIGIFVYMKAKGATIWTCVPVSLLFTWGISFLMVLMIHEKVSCLDIRISIAIFISFVFALIIRVQVKDY
jgi:hypothetical protein